MMIAMDGTLRGSAAVTPYEGGTAVKLNIRGGADGLRLYVSDGRSVVSAPLYGSEARIPTAGVCAAVLVRNGRIVSSGFAGPCAREKRRILDEILIREAAPARKQPEKPEPAPVTPPDAEAKKPVPAAKSRPPQRPARNWAAITEDILKKAELLFGALAGENVPQVPAPEPDPFEPVPNPFPATYPGSEWRRRRDEAGLFGTYRTKNGARELFALPIDVPGRKVRTRPGTRIVISRDGKRYLVTDR